MKYKGNILVNVLYTITKQSANTQITRELRRSLHKLLLEFQCLAGV